MSALHTAVLAAADNQSDPVSFGQAIIYGIVQGLTEFLPISSTAHLRIVPALFGWDDPGAAFTAVIQLGTTVAVIGYFWRELVHIALAWFQGTFIDKSVRASLECRMGWYMIIATIPIGIIGFLLRDQISTTARNLWLIATMMIILAIALAAAEKYGTRERDEEQINNTDALWVGAAQVLSLIPGSSRSGTTIMAGLFRGLDRPSAARFSFLLSIPAVLASGLFELKDIGKAPEAGEAAAPGVGVTVLATIIAFIVGLASIVWLMRWISQPLHLDLRLVPHRRGRAAVHPAGLRRHLSDEVNQCRRCCSSATD